MPVGVDSAAVTGQPEEKKSILMTVLIITGICTVLLAGVGTVFVMRKTKGE